MSQNPGMLSFWNIFIVVCCSTHAAWKGLRRKGRILARLRVQDDLDPFPYTLKLTNGSDQNVMGPLNFTRHGGPYSRTKRVLA